MMNAMLINSLLFKGMKEINAIETIEIDDHEIQNTKSNIPIKSLQNYIFIIF